MIAALARRFHRTGSQNLPSKTKGCDARWSGFRRREARRQGTIRSRARYPPSPEGFAMQTFLGMILGAFLLFAGVYAYDSIQTSSVASGQVAQSNRTIVNWDVAASDWHALKTRAHDDWIRISSK
jgi:hypothetical protein